MADALWVGTRKGLFKLGRAAGRWEVQRIAFLGVGVTAVLPDARDFAIYAAVGHGHFGAKLHRSRDGGASWQEVAAPISRSARSAPGGARRLLRRRSGPPTTAATAGAPKATTCRRSSACGSGRRASRLLRLVPARR